MKEDGQDSAIKRLDQSFEDSNDWNLNIDTSREILQKGDDLDR